MSLLRQLTPAQRWVVVLMVLTSALAVGNVGRAVVALQYASSLPDLSMTVSLDYFAVMGGFWGIIFVLCTVGLARFRDWGRWATLTAITLYQANVWANHFLFYVSDYARQATVRNLLLTGVFLLVFWVSLSLPAVRIAFRDAEERE